LEEFELMPWVQGPVVTTHIVLPQHTGSVDLILSSVSESQATQSESIVAKEIYSTSIVETQSVQTESIVAIEKYSATLSESQAKQTESIVVVETYRATISESQAVQSEAITVSEKYTVSLAESQSAQSESIAASESYVSTIAESQAVQDETITGTVTGVSGIVASIVEGQALQTEAITVIKAVPAPVQRPVQLVGMGGQWYTYYDLLRMGKKKLEESKAIPPVEKKRQTELTPAFSAALQRLGSKPRRRVAFHSIDITPVKDSMNKYVHHEARKTRARRDREAVEV
jgi:hypothetical protein